jgi:hypothetical protein
MTGVLGRGKISHSPVIMGSKDIETALHSRKNNR